jgi:uncharacterized protein YhaN
MSQNQTQDLSSEDTAGTSIDNHGDINIDNTRFVPVTESIRYRKRAQSAEKKLETLSEQLAQAKEQTTKLTGQLNSIRSEQELMRRLSAEATVDLEAAVIIAKAKMQGKDDADLNELIKQIKKEKPYLFYNNSMEAAATQKTAAAKERLPNSRSVLERAAKKAATTGNRTDLQEYLKLRRNYV